MIRPAFPPEVRRGSWEAASSFSQPPAPQGSRLRDTQTPLAGISAGWGRGCPLPPEPQAQTPPTRNAVSLDTHDPFLTLGPIGHPTQNPCPAPSPAPTLGACGPPTPGSPPQGPAAGAEAERSQTTLDPSHMPRIRGAVEMRAQASGGADKVGKQPEAQDGSPAPPPYLIQPLGHTYSPTDRVSVFRPG